MQWQSYLNLTRRLTPIKQSLFNHTEFPLLHGIANAVNNLSSVQDIQRTVTTSGVPMNIVRGGGSTNSVEDRENGDLGVVAP